LWLVGSCGISERAYNPLYRGLSTVHGDQAKLKGYDARIAVHWVSNPTGRCLEPTVTDYLAEPGERPRDADARTLMGADHAVGSFLIDKLRTGERGGTLTRTLTRTSLGRSVGRHDGSVTLQVGDDTVSKRQPVVRIPLGVPHTVRNHGRIRHERSQELPGIVGLALTPTSSQSGIPAHRS
jgi:hypothetical protein